MWGLRAARHRSRPIGLVLRGGGGPVAVDSGAVASAFPSQAITALNATGRVSAQRKAAVSTKATGRYGPSG